MATSMDLLLSILAMDAYSRGYRPALEGLGGEGSQIGTAKLLNTLIPDGSVEAGFYASAYTLDDGGTVISYRGTDDMMGHGPVGGDILNGWVVGAGWVPGSQAQLAMQFYTDVTGKDVMQLAENTTLVGHSLGGGLAGLVSNLSGTRAYVYDTMAFQLASVLQSALGGRLSVYQNFTAEHVTGEALELLRAAAVASPEGLVLPGYNSVAIDSFGGWRNPLKLHSDALLVILKYAQETNQKGWQAIGGALWDAAFDDNVAIASGLGGLGGGAESAGKLLAGIAYSALEEGNVFGNVGIRAMFNDANELGGLLGNVNTPTRLMGLAEPLTKLIVQFAGSMAAGKVDYNSNASALGGILSIGGESLSIDLSDKLWNLGRGLDATFLVKPVDILAGSMPASDEELGGLDGAEIQHVLIATYAKDGKKIHWFVAPEGDSLVIGGDGNDIIDGGNGRNFLYGGAGNDELYCNAGPNKLFGGGDNDKLYASFAVDGGSRGTLLFDNFKSDELRGGDGFDQYFVAFGEFSFAGVFFDFNDTSGIAEVRNTRDFISDSDGSGKIWGVQVEDNVEKTEAITAVWERTSFGYYDSNSLHYFLYDLGNSYVFFTSSYDGFDPEVSPWIRDSVSSGTAYFMLSDGNTGIFQRAAGSDGEYGAAAGAVDPAYMLGMAFTDRMN